MTTRILDQRWNHVDLVDPCGPQVLPRKSKPITITLYPDQLSQVDQVVRLLLPIHQTMNRSLAIRVMLGHFSLIRLQQEVGDLDLSKQTAPTFELTMRHGDGQMHVLIWPDMAIECGKPESSEIESVISALKRIAESQP